MENLKTKAGEFTYDDYLSWPDNERWQLLNGFAYAMAPPLVQHQMVVLEIGVQLSNQLRGHRCKALVAPVGVRLPKHNEADAHIRTVFEPDVIVVCDPSKIERASIRGAPDFIVEVLSPSTASFDQIEKRLAYEQAGVRELWLVDIASGVLTIYRATAGGFAPANIVRAEGSIAIDALPGVSIDLNFMLELRERD
jgi:Uma2 family endonuclease